MEPEHQQGDEPPSDLQDPALTIRNDSDCRALPSTPLTSPRSSKLLRTLGQDDSPTPPPKSVRPDSPHLRVVRGEQIDAIFQLREGVNVLGRAAEEPVDIDLGNQEAVEQIWTSRRHAAIVLETDGLYIEDLNSLNGTIINRSRIQPGQRYLLKSGDVVQLGTVQLRVEL